MPKIDILYEDQNILVVNKPTGILVHGDGRGTTTTVVDWFLIKSPEARGVGEQGFAQDGSLLERSGIVHRLDQETSGVLVLSKTQDTFEHLKQQFRNHFVKKEYRAFVYGTMKNSFGSINRPIGRSTKDFRLRSAQRGARGTLREATTHWELLEQSHTHAYLKVMPKTGRTHQIRVHLKAIGRPIVQDSLYAPFNLRSADNLGFSRLALHAHVLTIDVPKKGIQMFIAPLPPDFEKACMAIATV